MQSIFYFIILSEFNRKMIPVINQGSPAPSRAGLPELDGESGRPSQKILRELCPGHQQGWFVTRDKVFGAIIA
jgi:hypothetical protein